MDFLVEGTPEAKRGYVAGWHKLRDRATGGLRQSLSCEAEILVIHDDYLD